MTPTSQTVFYTYIILNIETTLTTVLQVLNCFFFQFTVNDIVILKQDMYTYGGVVNEIDGLFLPIFNNCDNVHVEEKMVRSL